ncbi:hypothetical protein P20652_1845 [Pseudoalteromonas sp. BSi20652]|nr:hypothetical protein P20652_1845 [Pseudoalteromonas sp. BSi20652]
MLSGSVKSLSLILCISKRSAFWGCLFFILKNENKWLAILSKRFSSSACNLLNNSCYSY